MNVEPGCSQSRRFIQVVYQSSKPSFKLVSQESINPGIKKNERNTQLIDLRVDVSLPVLLVADDSLSPINQQGLG
jgi:hypothetical protein